MLHSISIIVLIAVFIIFGCIDIYKNTVSIETILCLGLAVLSVLCNMIHQLYSVQISILNMHLNILKDKEINK